MTAHVQPQTCTLAGFGFNYRISGLSGICFGKSLTGKLPFSPNLLTETVFFFPLNEKSLAFSPCKLPIFYQVT